MGEGNAYKICILGEGAVGKTALTIQFCSALFMENYDPTIEDSYRRQVVVDEETCVIDILDTAGQEEFASLRDQWIKDSQGFILIYSIINRTSFESIFKFVNQIKNVKFDRKDIPIIIVGNKCDLDTLRQVSTEEGEDYSKKLNTKFFETSAKTGKNVENAYFETIRSIRLLCPPSSPKKNSFCKIL
eukprot:TRINITY_DN999_c0_g4_i1.p1 TRINITY_DN999_c0_g4~~TRINITY_DN999_c0_g4_i1.p1  ORF type:complete len:187 (-),score=41.28 TRINITY_DN999_c0_g4_i1:114-674(-)